MFKPVGSRVMVQKIEEVKKSGLLIMPSTSEEYSKAKVIAVGNGSYQNGVLIPVCVKEGDIVLYMRGNGQEITDDKGNKFEVILENAIIGIDN